MIKLTTYIQLQLSSIATSTERLTGIYSVLFFPSTTVVRVGAFIKLQYHMMKETNHTASDSSVTQPSFHGGVNFCVESESCPWRISIYKTHTYAYKWKWKIHINFVVTDSCVYNLQFLVFLQVVIQLLQGGIFMKCYIHRSHGTWWTVILKNSKQAHKKHVRQLTSHYSRQNNITTSLIGRCNYRLSMLLKRNVQK